MEESTVKAYIRKYLISRGWEFKQGEEEKGKYEHGIDIYAWHPKWRKTLIIETKGGSGKHVHQEKHNAFYNVLGQCLSRMDKEGNNQNKARIYAIGIPSAWAGVFRNKIRKMRFGWSLLKLKTFLVNDDGSVMEKPYSFFLK